MWPANGNYAPNQHTPRPWPNGPPPNYLYLSQGHGQQVPMMPANPLKRSFSDRHHPGYATMPAPRMHEPVSIRSAEQARSVHPRPDVQGPPQFRQPPIPPQYRSEPTQRPVHSNHPTFHMGHASHGAPPDFGPHRKPRPRPDEIERQTEIFTNGASKSPMQHRHQQSPLHQSLSIDTSRNTRDATAIEHPIQRPSAHDLSKALRDQQLTGSLPRIPSEVQPPKDASHSSQLRHSPKDIPRAAVVQQSPKNTFRSPEAPPKLKDTPRSFRAQPSPNDTPRSSEVQILPMDAPASPPVPAAKVRKEKQESIPLRLEEFARYLKTVEKGPKLAVDVYNHTLIGRANQLSDQDKITRHTKHVVLEKVSPFAKMTSLKSGRLQGGRNDISHNQRVLAHHSPLTSNEPLCVYPAHNFSAPAYTIPPYTHYISSKHNVLVEGDKQRTFLPYLGESTDDIDADYERLEEKVHKNLDKWKLLNEMEEFASPWVIHIDNVLVDLGTSVAAVLRFLIDENIAEAQEALPSEYRELVDYRTDWIQEGYYEDEDDAEATKGKEARPESKVQEKWLTALKVLPEVSDKELAAAVLACYTFMGEIGFSLWHVVRLTPTAAKASDDRLSGERDGVTPDAYISSACLVCKAHNCLGHGEYTSDDEGKPFRRTMTSLVDYDAHYKKMEEAIESRSGTEEPDLKTLLGLDENGRIRGRPWTNLSDDPAGMSDAELCSDDCFWSKANRARVMPDIEWSEEDSILLDRIACPYVNQRRGACALSRMGLFKQSCVNVFYKLMLMSESYSEAADKEEGSSRRPYPNKSWQWWLEETKTWQHDQREPFVPCQHAGLCKNNPECSCSLQGISCEKSCLCDSSCSRKFRGCRCAAKNMACALNAACDCRELNRECDPDLCTSCGSHEILDPANRYDGNITTKRCTNVQIQRAVPKRTQIGQSKLLADGGVVGWGLYMGESARRGDYIGEYIGEIVTPEESEQRGIIYNAMNLSYLFDLNSKQVLDSTPIGNKLRYINHQGDDFANCQAKVMFCGGVQRIGMFANREIKVGEELLFNYGDSFANKIDMIKIRKDGTVTVEKAKKGGDTVPKTSAHKKLPGDAGAKRQKWSLGRSKKGKQPDRAGSPMEVDGSAGDEDTEMIPAEDEVPSEEEPATYTYMDEDEDDDEEIYDDTPQRTPKKKKYSVGSMTASDRMRKAWVSRYRNLGLVEKSKQQEKLFWEKLGED